MSPAVVSPRTAAEPTAFTGLEFFRGLWLAFLWATGLISLAWTVAAFPYGLYSLMWVVPAAGAAAIVFAAPAWLLGQLLRRVRPLRWHVIAFATLGAVVGVVTTLAFLAWSGGPGPYIGGPLNVIYAINVSLSAAAVALGWWRAARRALRDDAARSLAARTAAEMPAPAPASAPASE